MTIGPTGTNLVFLISQPRAGSTLLQKMLGSHREIQTSVEPWILLPLVYLIKEEGVRGEYNDLNPNLNIMEFLDSIAGGRTCYMDGVREMMGNIYSAAISGGKRYFLDKTPRYYLIIPELAELFPDAKFILLFRNPIAVLASMYTTWLGSLGLLNSNVKTDLLKAPRLLVKGKNILAERAKCITYESLVTDPEKELADICSWLSIPYESSMIEYGKAGQERWKLGDQKTVYENTRPVRENTDRWKQFLHTAQNWRYANSYLETLGQETVEDMGYSFEELSAVMVNSKPSLIARIFTYPFLFSMTAHRILRKIYRGIKLKETIF